MDCQTWLFEKLLIKLQQGADNGYEVEGREHQYTDNVFGDHTERWVFDVNGADTSRTIGMYASRNTVTLSITGDGFNEVSFSIDFTSKAHWYAVDILICVIAEVLGNNTGPVVEGTEDELIDVMKTLHTRVEGTLQEIGATDCSYTGTLFNRTQVTA